mgnify:CR=1 FL=1|tara:strand:+ start:1699 stop:2280 length:582 start_codon:yes stop_codon:yes gene_type:complete
MEALTAATTFATLVGLLSSFRAERGSSEKADYDEFILWLGDKRHKELVQEIQSNHLLGHGIKLLLSEKHDEVMAKLAAIESTMAAVAANIGGLREISEAILPDAGLSSQAFSIIKQLSNSGGSFFLELKMAGGVIYQIMDASGQIDFDEPRFIEDDLQQLCNTGLLIPDYNSKGNRLFKLTRSAVKLVEASEL